jgi:hypothetical protein
MKSVSETNAEIIVAAAKPAPAMSGVRIATSEVGIAGLWQVRAGSESTRNAMLRRNRFVDNDRGGPEN